MSGIRSDLNGGATSLKRVHEVYWLVLFHLSSVYVPSSRGTVYEAFLSGDVCLVSPPGSYFADSVIVENNFV